MGSLLLVFSLVSEWIIVSVTTESIDYFNKGFSRNQKDRTRQFYVIRKLERDRTDLSKPVILGRDKTKKLYKLHDGTRRDTLLNRILSCPLTNGIILSFAVTYGFL